MGSFVDRRPINPLAGGCTVHKFVTSYWCGQVDSAFYPTWDGKISTSQRAVMLCDWGLKAGMVQFAGKTV